MIIEDVPIAIIECIENNREIYNDQNIEIQICFCIIAHYLGFDVVNSLLQKTQFESSRLGFYETARFSPRDQAFIFQLANTLFEMRRSKSIKELCRRMSSRDLRSASYEAYAASIFHELGFAITARPEVQIRGADFDFFAEIEGRPINVEVTVLNSLNFLEKSIINALQKKRKQLPADSPAVICCALPYEWVSNKIYDNLMDISMDFFASTKRINAIIFMIEEQSENNIFGLSIMRFFNENPRIMFEPLKRLHEYGFSLDPAELGLLRSGLEHTIPIDTNSLAYRQNELKRLIFSLGNSEGFTIRRK
jgi:hypothetical protein